MKHLRPVLYIDTDTASYPPISNDMDSFIELCVPPNSPMVAQTYNPVYSTPIKKASESTDTLASSIYSNSPVIFGSALPWALATLELEHRLCSEDTESPESTEPSPIDSICSSTTSLLSRDYPFNHVQTYVYPDHSTTRTVIRPDPSKSNSPFAFLRPAPTRPTTPIAAPNSPAINRPANPIPRPNSSLNSALRALRLITDSTMFEEDLDYHEHRWTLEQAGKGKIEVMVTKEVKVTVETVGAEEEEQDEVVYHRRRLPSLFGQKVPTFARPGRA